MNFDFKKLSGTVGDLSLRPLLTQVWIESYLRLNAIEKYHFISNFSDIVRANRTLKIEDDRNKNATGMEQMIKNLKVAHSYALSFQIPTQKRISEKFRWNVRNQMQKSGFFESSIEAQFDFIYVSPQKLSVKDSVLNNLIKHTKEMPKLQVAARDSSSLWLFPSPYPIELQSISKLRSQKMAVQVCGNYDFSFVLSYAEETEKLLVVNECDDDIEVDYTGYIQEGIETFSVQNPNLNFVQYHLLSLSMKAEELKNLKNVYELIQIKPSHQLAVKGLGWQKVLWNDSVQAYKPEATIEGVELFRIRFPESKL